MGNPIETITSDSGSLSTVAANLTLADVPESAHLYTLRVDLASLSASSGQVLTCYLATDTAGDEGETEIRDADVQYGPTSGKGWAVYLIDSAIGVGGSIYVRCTLDTGTATGTARLVLQVRDH